MEFTGLTGKYPVNRSLTEQEVDQQLKQKEALKIEPTSQLSVIRLNSTYIELVDKYFAWKGFIALFSIAAFIIVGGSSLYFTYGIIKDVVLLKNSNEAPPWGFSLVFTLVSLFCIWAFIKTIRYESFAYTHYPIRFNRRTRMVHAFRVNGTVLSVPWDDVFFCLGSLRQGNWEIQGHVLDQDGQTIKETFCAFPQIGGNQAEREKLKTHWEFVRRYMEDGPQDAHSRVKICLPIADQRERVSFGFHRMHGEGTGNLMTQLLAAVMAIAILPGRWFAMRTSKIPQWPAEIEAANQVEAGDPYVRDACMNPKWRELPDWVWLLISAVVWGLIIFGASGLEPLR